MRKVKNSLATCFLAGAIAAAAALMVFAAESTVAYEGGAEKFIFVPGNGNLFSDFTGVMPGDSLTQTITIKNAAKAGDGVNLYLRASGTDETAEGFLEQMNLTVQLDGKILSEDTAEKTAGLTQNVFLGHFTNQREISLEVTLDIPIEMDNRFQNAEGKITWVFTAEEMDSQLEPSGGNSGSGGGSENGGSGLGNRNSEIEGSSVPPEDELTEIGEESAPLAGLFPDALLEVLPETIKDGLVPLGLLPQTGDTSVPGVWILLLIISGCGATGLLVAKMLKYYQRC